MAATSVAFFFSLATFSAFCFSAFSAISMSFWASLAAGSETSCTPAQAARLFGVPNIIFTDSEFQSFNHKIAHPFATRIYTPQCFDKPLGGKQRRYNGYHELAFLHPARFTPRPEVLSRLSVNGGPSVNGTGGTGAPAPGQYVVIRTSAWNTLHDIGESGLGRTFDAPRHLDQPDMNAAVGGLMTKFSGDGESWSRRNSSSNIAPLVAATCALVRVPTNVEEPMIFVWKGGAKA